MSGNHQGSNVKSDKTVNKRSHDEFSKSDYPSPEINKNNASSKDRTNDRPTEDQRSKRLKDDTERWNTMIEEAEQRRLNPYPWHSTSAEHQPTGKTFPPHTDYYKRRDEREAERQTSQVQVSHTSSTRFNRTDEIPLSASTAVLRSTKAADRPIRKKAKVSHNSSLSSGERSQRRIALRIWTTAFTLSDVELVGALSGIFRLRI